MVTAPCIAVAPTLVPRADVPPPQPSRGTCWDPQQTSVLCSKQLPSLTNLWAKKSQNLTRLPNAVCLAPLGQMSTHSSPCCCYSDLLWLPRHEGSTGASGSTRALGSTKASVPSYSLGSYNPLPPDMALPSFSALDLLKCHPPRTAFPDFSLLSTVLSLTPNASHL